MRHLSDNAPEAKVFHIICLATAQQSFSLIQCGEILMTIADKPQVYN